MKLGAYHLIRDIARGGIADIYLAKVATSSGKEKYLVCKCLKKSLTQDTEFLNSIIHEVQISRQLHHENIVEIFDLCAVEGQAFLTMEYLDGLDFHKLLQKNSEEGTRVPYPLAIYAIGEVANGLHAAHELTDASGHSLHLVHRDISPENILFGARGEIKIADFGIAKTSNMPDITPPDTIKGKFNYMSPEHAWGDRLDRRADLFALAAILYEAVTGCSFYPTDSIAATMQCARTANYVLPHEILPDFPPDLEKILVKALDLDKNQRYATALEFRLALDGCAAQHRWHATRDDWTQYLVERLQIQDAKLPLMHHGDALCDTSSLIPIDGTALANDEDTDATGQILPDELAEILKNSGVFQTQEDVIRASSEAMFRSGAKFNAVPQTPIERAENDLDASKTVQCTAPDFDALMANRPRSILGGGTTNPTTIKAMTPTSKPQKRRFLVAIFLILVAIFAILCLVLGV